MSCFTWDSILCRFGIFTSGGVWNSGENPNDIAKENGEAATWNNTGEGNWNHKEIVCG